MAEQFLTLMADLDDEAQERMSGWYHSLQEAGFTGVQTPGLPYHISLSTFTLELEKEAAEIARKAAAEFAPVPVHLSHIGMFAGGKVLFAGPEKSAKMAALQEACRSNAPQQYPWTPHATVLIDEPETVHAAIPVFVKSFVPFMARIVRLHLCAFWPTREIGSFALEGRR